MGEKGFHEFNYCQFDCIQVVQQPLVYYCLVQQVVLRWMPFAESLLTEIFKSRHWPVCVFGECYGRSMFQIHFAARKFFVSVEKPIGEGRREFSENREV